MSALKPLISHTCEHFSLHPARLETLNNMIFSAMTVGNVHQVSLARHLGAPNPKSALRRLERFFQKEVLTFPAYAKAAVEMLGFKRKLKVCLDRTNWKFGKKDINYLVLSLMVNPNVSIPLFAVELDKAGNSNTEERISLLEAFEKVFGLKRIGLLLADREFVGEKWFKQLIKEKIPFCIRIKGNALVPYGDDPIHVRELFDHLSRKEYRIVQKDMYGSTVYFAGTRGKEGELVIVMSNQPLTAKKILDQYRRRWSIEEMFKKFKTSGFNWENTHMKKSDRLITLLIILSIAALLLFCIGWSLKVVWKKTLKCSLWSVFKRGMIHFQHTAAKSLKRAVKMILKAIESAGNLIENQK